MDKNKYIGLTIGPIFKTIEKARSTGELWGSSYMFSYIIKNIINRLINDFHISKEEFIVPYVEDSSILYEPQKIGLFHDRFIFRSNPGDFEKVEKAVECIKTRFSENLASNLGKKDADCLKKYVDSYLKIYFVEVEVDPDDDIEEDRNIIFKVSKYLNAVELREKVSDYERHDYILELLDNKNIKKSFLAADAYGKGGRKDDYPSLFKIAVGGLGVTENEDSDIRVQIKKHLSKDEFKKAYEYVAVVNSDGDSISKVIEKFKNKKDYSDFSKKLLNYARKSNEIIEKYSGFTIYAGGDDLLFIAPLVNLESSYKNVFGLIDRLSKIFVDEFVKYKNSGKSINPTTSFGVSIVHHKYPLYFALDESRNLLSEKAKEFKYNGTEKNAISFKLIKNSGQSFGMTVRIGNKPYEKFKDILGLFISQNDYKTDNYLKQLNFKILKDKAIFSKIGRDNQMVKNYFKNNFNEDIHKTPGISSYIELITDLINKIYEDYKNCEDNEKKDPCMEELNSYLRFIKFMSEKSSLDDVKVDGEGEKNE